MHKLSGTGSRVDLPDLGCVDQCYEDLAIRANSNVFDPLQWKNVIVSTLEDTTIGDDHSQCRSRSGTPFGQDHLRREPSMVRQCCGKRRERSRISRSESVTFWGSRRREQGR